MPVNISGIASTSRGLVGDTVFAVLPNIKPSYTFTITIASQVVCRFSGAYRESDHFLDRACQVMVHSNVQVFPYRPNVVWLLFFPLRMACPRESHTVGACSIEVC